jgi:hypothetical protein
MKIPLVLASDMTGAVVALFVWATYAVIFPVSFVVLFLSFNPRRQRATAVGAAVILGVSALLYLPAIFDAKSGVRGASAWLLMLPALLGLAALANTARAASGTASAAPEAAKTASLFCYAKLNERIQPIARGDAYEDPLIEALEKNGFGSVTGGGTSQERTGEIEYAGIDIDLTNREEGIPFICRFLEERGAPKGSELQVGEERFPFGKVEAIAVYFDGVNLPAEVYAQSDINVVIEEIGKLIAPKGEIRGNWEGATETALYLYGESAATMRSQIADFLATYPLGKGARVVTFAPSPK